MDEVTRAETGNRTQLCGPFIPVLGKYFGQLCLVFAAMTVVLLAVSLIHGETPIVFRHAIVIVALTGSGGILGRIPAPREIQINVVPLAVLSFFS